MALACLHREPCHSARGHLGASKICVTSDFRNQNYYPVSQLTFQRAHLSFPDLFILKIHLPLDVTNVFGLWTLQKPWWKNNWKSVQSCSGPWQIRVFEMSTFWSRSFWASLLCLEMCVAMDKTDAWPIFFEVHIHRLPVFRRLGDPNPRICTWDPERSKVPPRPGTVVWIPSVLKSLDLLPSNMFKKNWCTSCQQK